MNKFIFSGLISLLIFGFNGLALADSSITINIYPSQVPDENLPGIHYGDAPTGFGLDSWQNSTTGKVNWHARYGSDGNFLSALFPTQAATLTLSDIDSISYWTKRPVGTPAQQDWAVFIYTRPDGNNDGASWYGYRFVNNFDSHTATDQWTQYSTDTGMTFRDNKGNTHNSSYRTLDDLGASYGNELIEMISVQTMSNYSAFNGYMDGLTITLKDGSVGRVNFSAVPAPGAIVLGIMGVGLVGWIKRRLA